MLKRTVKRLSSLLGIPPPLKYKGATPKFATTSHSSISPLLLRHAAVPRTGKQVEPHDHPQRHRVRRLPRRRQPGKSCRCDILGMEMHGSTYMDT